MLQQIHLEDSFLTGHRLHVELLGSHKLECALFGFLRCERSFVRSADERVLTQAAGQTGLILADLAFDGRHGRVDRREHIGRALTGAEVGVRCVNRNFDVVAVLLNAEGDKSVGVGAEETFKLHDFLFRILVNVLRQGYLLFGVLESHSYRSFRNALLPRDLSRCC